MAPVLAIPGMVATGVEHDSSLDPVGEILKPIATGPGLADFPEEENKDGNRQDESKAEERAGAAGAVGEPGAGGGASQSRWDRRGERRPLRVAVRPDQDPEPVRRFECFTADLRRLADWLETCGVETIAIRVGGLPFTVIGVTPREFSGTEVDYPATLRFLSMRSSAFGRKIG
jgi:hypothetical protein